MLYSILIKNRRCGMEKEKKKEDRGLERLWPAIQGSISEVRKPCVNKNCEKCRSGEKHPATILTYWIGKKHYCMYVPKALVPELKRALKNGRKLEKMMKEMGPRLIREYRRKRKKGK